MERTGFKMYKEVTDGNLFSGIEHDRIGNFFRDKKLDKRYYYIEDDYTQNPYKDDYFFDLGKSEKIWILTGEERNTEVKELSEVSDIVRILRNNISRTSRAYIRRSKFAEFKEYFEKKR